MKRIYLFIFLILGFLLSGCQASTNAGLPPIPDVGIDPALLNKDLKIDFFPNSNTFKIGDDVILFVTLITSDVKIRTTNNFNARMFFLDNSSPKWVEVSDVGNYIDQAYPIIDKTNKKLAIFLRPDLNEKSKDTTLLVIVTGDVMDGDLITDHVTGAYKVVTLKP